MKRMSNTIKKLVSKNKRRFETEGFNLDLSYVTEQVIAMGFPSERVESVFRNSLEDVRRYEGGLAAVRRFYVPYVITRFLCLLCHADCKTVFLLKF